MSFNYSVDEMVLGAGRESGIPKGKMLQNGGKERFRMLGRMSAWDLCVLEGMVGGEAVSKGPEAEVIGGH